MIDFYEPRSTFTWLDYSDADQRSMQQVIDLFREKDTRDELGLGTVRDALSDLLLPGTSTIQTRARYFLFVPWLVQQITSGLGPRNGTPQQRLHTIESWLIASLGHGGVGAREGLIGRRTRQLTKRMPSSIFWNGLYVWGIRRWDGSIDALLHGSADEPGGKLRLSDDGDFVSVNDEPWHLALPTPPNRFFKFEGVNFDLTTEEAIFLRDTIHTAVPDSLLAWLVLNGESTDASYLWQHPQRLSFPPRHEAQLTLAERFSTIMYGASLLYGRMLAERHPEPAMLANIHPHWVQWFESAKRAAAQWNDDEFWPVVRAINQRISPYTITFVKQWVTTLQHAESLTAMDVPAVRHVIVQREHALKHRQARLSNQHAYDAWLRAVDPSWQPFQFDYRWQTFQRILNDILAPLESIDAQA